LSFCVWLISLSMPSSKFIHAVTCVRIVHRSAVPCFASSSIFGHLGQRLLYLCSPATRTDPGFSRKSVNCGVILLELNTMLIGYPSGPSNNHFQMTHVCRLRILVRGKDEVCQVKVFLGLGWNNRSRGSGLAQVGSGKVIYG
jgi:hypothetical protein